MALISLQLEREELTLVVSALEQVLETLYQANEKRGGNDAELIEYGRQYSLVLQKLQPLVTP